MKGAPPATVEAGSAATQPLLAAPASSPRLGCDPMGGGAAKLAEVPTRDKGLPTVAIPPKVAPAPRHTAAPARLTGLFAKLRKMVRGWSRAS